jgi:hypothetical protein
VRKTLFTVLILLAVSWPFWAASETDSGVSIRFYDRKVYFLGDPIQVEATITNSTPQPLRFKMADNTAFSLDFDVRTATNLPLDHSRDFTSRRNSDQPVFFREVSLEPGEKYGFVVDLGQFTAFAGPGLYVVQATFFPELWKGPGSAAWQSNRLALNVKPAVVAPEEKARIEAETGALIARQALPPDEVVAYTLSARQKSQWEKFFLYLDLEALLRRNPERDRTFRKSAEEDQRRMVERFRQELRQVKMNQEISLIPLAFEVRKTSYNASDATVLVREKFKYPDYTEVKDYTYHLKKSDRYWIISDYEIKNLGTE